MTDPTSASQTEAVTAPTHAEPDALEDFPRLFRAHASYLSHSLRRLGVREADLEDLTHEVFLVVHRIRGSFDATRPLRPWLFGIAFRVASDYRRTAYVAREIATDTMELDAPSRLDDNPERETERRRTRAIIIAALDSIPLDRRAVLVLHEIDKTPIPEVAEALSIPLNTAYSRLRVARGEFKSAYARLARSESGGSGGAS